MNASELDRLKGILGLEDIDVPSVGPGVFFWNIELDDDELPGWRQTSAQNVAVSVTEKLSSTTWMPASEDEADSVWIDISTFANWVPARTGFLQRVAAAHVPGLTRIEHSDLGEFEFRTSGGGALIFQHGNMVVSLSHLGPGDSDLSVLAGQLHQTLLRSLETAAKATEGTHAAEAKEELLIGASGVRIRARRRVPVRLESESVAMHVMSDARSLGPEPGRDIETAATGVATPPPPWPVPQISRAERIVLMAENGDVHIDGDGLSVTPKELGTVQVTLVRKKPGTAPEKGEYWTFEVEN